MQIAEQTSIKPMTNIFRPQSKPIYQNPAITNIQTSTPHIEELATKPSSVYDVKIITN